ncbi:MULTISPECIES: protein YgfX [unclassified Pseudomonas]|uniref:protein YgfX n=1 Tax=unclassified Pseudomonas TaxID=196821 RepID=UPI000838A0BA|nr:MULTISPECIES: protein YgfX [unclassified Pseudomonas]QIH06781.1 hypothetical protein ATY02_08695 [Pseudomonas sp. BIOMIG1BAC]
MSNPSKLFECRWQASRLLLAAYLLAQAMALGAIFLLDIPSVAKVLAVLSCLLHGAWVLPRQVLLTHSRAFRCLRHGTSGWQLWSPARGWQAVELRPDSLALPLIVVLRFRLPGRPWVHCICVPWDSMASDEHRRLRVRLKFGRSRWGSV